MRAFWVGSLGLVALLTASGCKQKEPEPIPAPKAMGVAVAEAPEAAGIAWFQGSLDEAFSRRGMRATCAATRAPMAPLTPDLSRPRARAPSPAPSPSAIRRPLV